jgi:hypothetical protein
MIGHDEPSLAFFGSSFGNGEEDQRGAGIDPKLNSKSSPNEAAISKYHFTPYHHAVSALTKF